MSSSRFAEPPQTATPRAARDAAADAAVLAAGDRSLLIRGGVILSQDPSVGDFATGDVLVREGRIAAVGADLSADAGDAVVLDAADTIVVPGFVDSHVHAWEGQLRGMAPVLDFGGYLGFTAFGFGPHYTAHDNYVGTLATALVALDAGITTIVDNSHNTHSPDHASAAVEALIDAGIRGVHASGAPVSGAPEGWPADISRLRAEYFASDNQLVTLRLFDLYPSADLWELAKSEGLWMSHEMGAHIENLGDVVADFAAKGLLTEQHSFNHCFDMPDKVWDLIADSGATVNMCPRSDAAFGLGSSFPPLDSARSAGLVPGLSGDNEVSYGLSMFAEMQALLSGHRSRTFARALSGDTSGPGHLSPGDVLRYATVGGAANAGLAGKVGSITPGLAADLVLLRTSDVNTAPGSNAVATVTAFAHAGNVDTVLVGGSLRKFRGALVGQDLPRVRALVEASRDRLLSARGLTSDTLAAEGGSR